MARAERVPDRPPIPPDQSGVPPERLDCVREFLDRLTRWATARGDVVGLLLVGSYARRAARPSSDVDVVLLTTDPTPYLTATRTSGDAGADWAGELGLGRPVRTRAWGPVTERRFALACGPEVEFGIGTPQWARTDPVDPGTRRVVTDGALPLYDPVGVLAELVLRCRS
ncbi:nucleotidyltransferase domain-containing protein [Streptomyces sp. NPDC001034]|uniref:nucleotidyltransferase domain-containing protein n=1 Tax=Streptomyces sp. NPDC001034 TaxID=3154375 RepID=UPI003324ABD2